MWISRNAPRVRGSRLADSTAASRAGVAVERFLKAHAVRIDPLQLARRYPTGKRAAAEAAGSESDSLLVSEDEDLDIADGRCGGIGEQLHAVRRDEHSQRAVPSPPVQDGVQVRPE